MKGNRNPNTRAIVSALRCDYPALRAAAAELVDKATAGSDEQERGALMVALDCEQRTADKILRERALVTKTGARKRKGASNG